MHETRITQQTYSANNSKDNNVNFQIKAQQTFFEIFYPRANNFPLHTFNIIHQTISIIPTTFKAILKSWPGLIPITPAAYDTKSATTVTCNSFCKGKPPVSTMIMKIDALFAKKLANKNIL
ncbi:hypothetical protein Hanom_Chr11g01051141 [Helianthus anomalus]